MSPCSFTELFAPLAHKFLSRTLGASGRQTRQGPARSYFAQLARWSLKYTQARQESSGCITGR